MDENSAIAEPKKIHPFFSAPKKSYKESAANSVQPVTPDPSCSPNSEKAHEPAGADADGSDDAELGGRIRKRCKTSESATETKQTTNKRVGRPKRQSRTSTVSTIASHFGQKESNTTAESSNQSNQSNESTQSGTKPLNPPDKQDRTYVSSQKAEKSTSTTELNSEKSGPSVKPLKLLQFNPKTGTIGSPPKTTSRTEEPNGAKKSVARSGNRRGHKKTIGETSRIVCVQYGVNEEARTSIGEKIEEIFNGIHFEFNQKETGLPSDDTKPHLDSPSSLDSDNSPACHQTPRRNTPKERQTPKKPTHPFFTGKTKPAASTPSTDVKEKPKSPVKRHTIFTSTPCSPSHVRPAPQKFQLPQFGMKSGGLKVPGAQHPAWPSQGMAHIHGDHRDQIGHHNAGQHMVDFPGKKLKGQESRIPEEESIVYRAASRLDLELLAEELKTLSTENFNPPPPELRIPKRCFESGKRLRERIDPELRTCVAGVSLKTHPAIAHLYESLPTSLSAFDQSNCENLPWAQKYSPNSSDRVLQSGEEARLLRDWLLTLKVQSIHKGSSDTQTSKSKSGVLSKKKKKRKKLEGFVVSSDEGENDMNDISEGELDWTPNGSQGSINKTVIKADGSSRGSKDNVRLTNAVVLSGPHGCGKTATVYAIAKELDFEVFEIHSGSRRSGKDVLEKIGDMTRNHLVQHRQGETGEEENEAQTDDEVTRDLKSGKQGMMTAFFKPKAAAQPKKPKKSAPEPKQPVSEKTTKKSLGASQKQSLILLEEVDVLYDEDKQFWSTVIGLMAQSKRPFIMTCNDENLVPLHNLNLHGIFRFGTPPKEPAVDLLLLVAASEGHALARLSVEALFDSREHDLRASIMELNYWCQIGVGDLKGGFGWYPRRWPKGIDVDEKGDKIRVVSAGTYHEGMGWLGRDATLVPSAYRSIGEEVIQQLWENWGVDVSDFQLSANQASWAHKASNPGASRSDRLRVLEAADTFADLTSAVDNLSMGSLSLPSDAALDPTQPKRTNKSKEDFVIGHQLLDTAPLIHYRNTSFELASTLANSARELLVSSIPASCADTKPIDHITATSAIRNSFVNPTHTTPSISRHDYNIAFDPIAISEKSQSQSSGYLDPSVFDRTMELITLDVAPYVRSIVTSDQRLQQERLSKSNLLSKGGNPKKRMRTTRSAYSAMEGGSRASTRREKYFSADVNPHLVMRTGGGCWGSLLTELLRTRTVSSSASTSAPQSSDEDMDISMD